MIPRAVKFVSYPKVEDHFRLGWMVMFPNASHHHQYYGCELAWICPCPVPGGFKISNHRVPITEREDEHERYSARR